MTNTPHLSLPLLQAAQAQKHVTVNEALVRLDGLTQLTLKSVTTSIPPGVAADGDCYGLPAGAQDGWAGNGNDIAIYSNGGWTFATPEFGWSAWIEDQSERAVFDGSVWVGGGGTLSPNGASMVQKVSEFDHVIGSGATSSVVAALPAHAIVYGVTGRVIDPLTGALTGWRLGVAGADDRYGSGLGTAAGSWMRGLTSTPLVYYSDTDLMLSAEGGNFTDGKVRLAVHWAFLTLPSA